MAIGALIIITGITAVYQQWHTTTYEKVIPKDEIIEQPANMKMKRTSDVDNALYG